MDLKIFTKNIEDKAKEQIDTLIALEPFKESKIRIMPDVHAGAGCVIGFTADLGDKVIPNIVGVDLYCGMLCVSLGKIDIDFSRLDRIIKQNIPSGREVHKNSTLNREFLERFRCFEELSNIEHLERSLGTLGGGNHFIEIDEDNKGEKYLIIHTGSRNLGKQVAEIYQEKAINYISGAYKFGEDAEKLIEEYKASGRHAEINDALNKLREEYKAKEPNFPKELCYLEGGMREDYLHDIALCQRFADSNRRLIAQLILELMEIDGHYLDNFTTLHNYVDLESNIIRKGAISAKKGERVLIPMNMRDGCIIGLGKGNEDWNCSAPHGAGRLMSRRKAKESISLDEYKKSMEGIYSTTVTESTIDESPFAYKPMQEIIDAIEPTVEIQKIIRPIYNFKASE